MHVHRFCVAVPTRCRKSLSDRDRPVDGRARHRERTDILSPLTNLGIEDVEPKDSGAASGLVNAAQQIGGAIGLSAMVTAGADASDMAV